MDGTQDWDKWKNAIHTLYILQKRPLQGPLGVMEQMEMQHGIRRSKAQYERQFKKWGFTRNATKESWQIVSRKVEKRKREGKASAVYEDGLLVPSKKICKEISRQGYMTTQERLKWAQAPSPRTPAEFQIHTPPTIPVRRLAFQDLPILQFQDAVRNLTRHPLPSLYQSSSARIPSIGTMRIIAQADSMRSVFDSFLPTSAFKDEFHGSELAIERVDQMGSAQTLNLVAFMVSNNLSPISNGNEICRWLKEQRMVYSYIFRVLKGPYVDALLETLFGLAIKADDVQVVRDLLEAGANPNAPTIQHPLLPTPLQFACLMGSTRMVKELIEAGSQVDNTESGWRGSILVLAIYSEKIVKPNLYDDELHDDTKILELVKVLVDAGAEVNPSGDGSRDTPASMKDWNQKLMPPMDEFHSLVAETHSPLTMAAKYRFDQVVGFLIQNKADVHFRVNHLHSALRESFQSLESFNTFSGMRMEKPPRQGMHYRFINLMNLTWSCSSDWPGLTWSCSSDWPGLRQKYDQIIKVVRSLIDAGVDVNDHLPCTDDDCSHDKFECFSTLDFAIIVRDMELIDIMISAGANTTRHSLNIALDVGTFAQFLRVVNAGAPLPEWTISSTDEILVDSASSRTEINRTTILDRRRKRALILKAMRTRQTSYLQALRMPDDHLHIDIEKGWAVLVNVLEECYDYPQAWHYLLENDVLLEPLRSRVVNHLFLESVRNGHGEKVDLLLRAGAEINKATDGETPLSVAIRQGNSRLVRMLIQAGASLGKGTAPGRHVEGLGNLLVQAIRRDDNPMIEEIIQAGADINSLGVFDIPYLMCRCCSPLAMAIQRKNWPLVDRLRASQASVNSSCIDPGEHTCQTPLWAAVAGKHWALVRSLMEDGAKVNDQSARLEVVKNYNVLKLWVKKLRTGNHLGQKFPGLRQALTRAFSRDSAVGSAELIIQSGFVDVNAFDGDRRPLCDLLISTYSAESRNRLLHLLLQSGADPNLAVNRFLWNGEQRESTALEVAIEARDLQSIKTLLDHGASDNGSEEGVRLLPVQLAARTGDLEILQLLLDNRGDPNAASACGQRRTTHLNTCFRIGAAIQEATKIRGLEMVSMLLNHGADVDMVTQCSPHTALQIACLGGNQAIAELVLKHGANVNALPDGENGMAIREAMGTGSFPSMQLILHSEADFHMVTQWYPRTALQIACRGGNIAIVELLLEYGANINALPDEKRGATALQFAAIGGYLGIAHLLLEKGADVNAPPAAHDGRTALEGAAEHGRIDMVQLLLNAGVDTSDKGQEQLDRALRRALRNGHLATRRLILSFIS